MPPERRAYICRHKDCVPPRRTFVLPGDVEPPRCPEHGRMVRQTNMRHNAGKSAKGGP